MTNTKNGSNQGMVPEARAAMDRFKMEAAAEDDVPSPSYSFKPQSTYIPAHTTPACRTTTGRRLFFILYPFSFCCQ